LACGGADTGTDRWLFAGGSGGTGAVAVVVAVAVYLDSSAMGVVCSWMPVLMDELTLLRTLFPPRFELARTHST
jgi:hypothetical protein